MRISIPAVLSIAVLAPAGLLGQPLTFEVVSIKPAAAHSQLGRGIFTFPGGRVAANGCTLEKLIVEAFGVQPFQVSGGPRWIHEDRYDIVAKPSDSSRSSKSNPSSPKAAPSDEQRQMLQTLLKDRFQLKYHIETKEGPVYLLVRGNKDLKLDAAKNRDSYPWVGGIGGGAISGDGLAGTNASMQELARRLSPYLQHPVLEQTGIEGSFDFKYEYHSADTQPDMVASILSSVQGLGLELKPGKGPVEALVVDQAQKPAEN